jgi:hypothetical protein
LAAGTRVLCAILIKNDDLCQAKANYGKESPK